MQELVAEMLKPFGALPERRLHNYFDGPIKKNTIFRFISSKIFRYFTVKSFFLYTNKLHFIQFVFFFFLKLLKRQQPRFIYREIMSGVSLFYILIYISYFLSAASQTLNCALQLIREICHGSYLLSVCSDRRCGDR